MLNYRRILIIMVLFLAASFSSIAYGATIIIAEITVKSLNIRDQPSTRGKIVGSFKKGEKVIAFLEYPGWVTVSVNGNTPGYISSKYIKVLKVIFSESDSSFYGDEFMSVQQLNDGRWVCRYYADKKQKWKYFGRGSEAEQTARAFNQSKRLGA